MPYCPSCGKQVTENAQYCPWCGHSLFGHAESKTTDEIPYNMDSKKQLMPMNTSGNKDKASKLSTTVLICGIVGVVCTVVSPLLLGLMVGIEGDKFGSSSSFLDIVLGVAVGAAIILDLLAIILGVACLLRKPTSVSRRRAKAGLLLGAIGPILFGLMYILTRV